MITRGLLIGLALLMLASPARGQEEESIQTLSSIVDQMNSLWQTFQQPLISPERAGKIAEQIIRLRAKAGMLSHRRLAAAFSLRAWREQQNGQTGRALEIYRYAIALDPFSREIRTGYAGARLARNPVNLFDYIPAYSDGLFVAMRTQGGRSFVLVDMLVWLGVAGIVFFSVWLVYTLIVYLPLVHYTFSTLIALFITGELAGVVALQLLGIPFALIPAIWYSLLLIAGLCWAVQPLRLKLVSAAAVIFAAVGTASLDTANVMVKAITLPNVQAAFSVETFDGNRANAALLRNRLVDEGVISGEGLNDDMSRKQRLDLFLYGFGMRKIGMTRDGSLRPGAVFSHLDSPDSLGMRARVNWANIRIERDDFRAGTQAYRSVLGSGDIAEAYALYNLARLNYTLGNINDAEQFMASLASNFPEALTGFNLNDIEQRPQLLDAGLTAEEIQYLIETGIAEVSGSREDRSNAVAVFTDRLTNTHSAWMFFGLGVMLATWLLLRGFGHAAYCQSCGKRYNKHTDLDPANSKICQACNSIKALHDTHDAELRRRQQGRVEAHSKRTKWLEIASLVFFPPAILIFRQKGISTLANLIFWSLGVALLYILDKLPRLESLPYFSHWTILSVLAVILLLAVSYVWSIVYYLLERRD